MTKPTLCDECLRRRRVVMSAAVSDEPWHFVLKTRDEMYSTGQIHGCVASNRRKDAVRYVTYAAAESAKANLVFLKVRVFGHPSGESWRIVRVRKKFSPTPLGGRMKP
jgi:hypothetical protein